MAMDPDELETCALGCVDSLFAYAKRLTREADQAEDLVQETLARFFGNQGQISEAGAVRPTLFRILHNLFIDTWRRGHRGPQMVSTEELSEERLFVGSDLSRDPAPLEALMGAGFSDEVEAALGKLDDPLREIVLLREIEDLSYQEISEITECPVGTVRSRLSRARGLLAARLGAYARERGLLRAQSKLKGEESS